MHRRVLALSLGFSQLAATECHLADEKSVAIFCDNCPEWLLCDLACARAGIVSVAMSTAGEDFGELLRRLQEDDICILVTSQAWATAIVHSEYRFEHLRVLVQLEAVDHTSVVEAGEKHTGLRLLDLAFSSTSAEAKARCHDNMRHHRIAPRVSTTGAVRKSDNFVLS